MKKLLLLSAFLPLGLLAQSSVPLVNASFDNNSGYFGDIGTTNDIFNLNELTGWSVTAFGGSANYAGAGSDNPPSNINGSNTGYIGSFGNGAGSGDFNLFTRAADLPAAIVGNTYTGSIFLRDDTFNGLAVTGTFFVEFFDASKVLLTSVNSPFTISSASATTDALEGVSASGVAPSGAAFVGLRVNLTSSSLFDNATLSTAPIPEPSSASALVALGAAGFVALRRRRAS
jgi:hypothetical protein